MSSLALTKNASGVITKASIDSVPVEGLVFATQALSRGSLSAVLTINFDSISVVGDTAEALTAVFAAGEATGATKATITDTLGVGNHFAYVVGSTAITAPTIDDTISDAVIYTSGADITGVDDTTNKYVGLYELTASNKAIKFLAHTVITSEIQS